LPAIIKIFYFFHISKPNISQNSSRTQWWIPPLGKDGYKCEILLYWLIDWTLSCFIRDKNRILVQLLITSTTCIQDHIINAFLIFLGPLFVWYLVYIEKNCIKHYAYVDNFLIYLLLYVTKSFIKRSDKNPLSISTNTGKNTLSISKFECIYSKGQGHENLIWLKVVSLDRSWLVGLTDDI